MVTCACAHACHVCVCRHDTGEMIDAMRVLAGPRQASSVLTPATTASEELLKPNAMHVKHKIAVPGKQ